MRLRTHDPERAAAEYVPGEQRRRARRRFEEHLLSCEECWREVSLGREGRRLAESTRELAPPHIRDDVRGTIQLAAGSAPRRIRIGRVGVLSLTAAVLLVGVLVTSSLRSSGPGEPAPIADAAAAYRSGLTVQGGTSHPAPDLGREGFFLDVSGRSELGDMAVDSFLYRSPAGGTVLLFFGSEPFPAAAGATHRSGGFHGWTASVGGLSLACGDAPQSYLLVGSDPATLSQIEATLQGNARSVAG
jgi:hypothetical protein